MLLHSNPVCSCSAYPAVRTGFVKWRRSRSRRDAVGALDRFRETSIVTRTGVRGDVPPHPLPSGECLFLIFPRCAWACFLMVLIVLVLFDFWSCSFGVSRRASGALGWARCEVAVAGNHGHPGISAPLLRAAKKPDGQLGFCPVRRRMRPDLRRGGSASDREAPLVTGVNGTPMARPVGADLRRDAATRVLLIRSLVPSVR